MKPGFRALLFAGLLLLLPQRAAAQLMLFGIDQATPTLGVIDPTNAATLSTLTITLSGQTVLGGNGLAVDPTSGTMYALLRLSGQPGRQLVTLNSATGVATSVGNTTLNLASLAITSGGVIYAVTGDGATPPETLYTLNKTTGAPTLITALGNGDDGEALVFNPLDGLMYHASGHTGAGSVIFEKINLGTLAITDIDISTTLLIDEEAQALAFDPVTGTFYWKQSHGTGPLFRVTPGGSVTLLGDTDYQWKGLAVAIPEPPAALLLLAGAGALALRRLRRRR